MARLFSDGAEFGDLLFWDNPTSISADNAQKRSGNYSYYAGNWGGAVKVFPSPLSEFYMRYAFREQATPGANFEHVFKSGGTTLIAIVWNPTSEIWDVKIGGVTVASTSYMVPFYGVWALWEIYVKIDDAPNGRFVLKISGATEVDYTGDTKPGADTTIDRFGTNNVNAFGCNFDDMALNDTTGLVDNSWCGDEHYEILNPNGNGDTNDWTGSDGDKVNNYALVDEIPPTGDTDYVASDTPTEQDMYNLTAFTDTGKVVTRVWAECRARDANASSGEIKIGFKTGGTVYLCSTDRVLLDIYRRVVGDEALVNPADSGVWEKADLDALQFVAECE